MSISEGSGTMWAPAASCRHPIHSWLLKERGSSLFSRLLPNDAALDVDLGPWRCDVGSDGFF